MVGSNKRVILIIGIVLCAVLWLLEYRVSSGETVTLTTNTLERLDAHEHDAGEAVEDQGHHVYIRSEIFTAPRDMWISAFTFSLYNAPDTSLHHMALLNLDTPHQTCSNIPFGQMVGFAQDSMHRPTISFPPGTGMSIKKGERLQLVVMLHNPLPPVGPGGTYHAVSASLRMTMHPSFVVPRHEIKLHVAHLDQEACVMQYADGSEAFMFTVPPHAKGYVFSASSTAERDPGRFVFEKDSVIVYMGGHVHGWQGGTSLFVDKNGDSFLSFETRAAPQHPYRYDSEYYPTRLRLEQGDVLTLRAVYDNPHDVPTRGAMGVYEMYYYEE
jgi:hypothetical protein